MVKAMRPSKGMRAVDRKLLSHLEWPYEWLSEFVTSEIITLYKGQTKLITCFSEPNFHTIDQSARQKNNKIRIWVINQWISLMFIVLFFFPSFCHTRIERFHHVRDVTYLIDLPTRRTFWCTRDAGLYVWLLIARTVSTAISAFSFTKFLPPHLTKGSLNCQRLRNEELPFLPRFYELILMATLWKTIKFVRVSSFTDKSSNTLNKKVI